MEQQQEAQTVAVTLKRKSATQLFVVYRSEDKELGMVNFDFKSDLDNWLSKTNVTVIKIIRGVEKEFTTQTKILIS